MSFAVNWTQLVFVAYTCEVNSAFLQFDWLLSSEQHCTIHLQTKKMTLHMHFVHVYLLPYHLFRIKEWQSSKATEAKPTREWKSTVYDKYIIVFFLWSYCKWIFILIFSENIVCFFHVEAAVGVVFVWWFWRFNFSSSCQKQESSFTTTTLETYAWMNFLLVDQLFLFWI
jgi:hypothetical protein